MHLGSSRSPRSLLLLPLAFHPIPLSNGIISLLLSHPHLSLRSLLARTLNVLRTGLFVLRAEELRAVPRQPRAEFRDLLFDTRDGLRVHVGLGDEFWHVD
jgi:hypothetical protein